MSKLLRTDRLELLKSELGRVVDIIIKDYKPEKIILFGSMVSERDVHEWSDIDLFIVKDTDKDYYDRVSEIDDLINCAVGMDIIVLNKQEYEEALVENEIIKQEIVGKGRVIYESSSSFG